MSFYILKRQGKLFIERREEVHFVKGAYLWKDNGSGQVNRGEIMDEVEGVWPGKPDGTIPPNVQKLKEAMEATQEVMES